MLKITSRENQKIKNLIKIRQGKNKQLLFIEGVRLIEEVVRTDTEITELFISTKFGETDRERELLREIETRLIEISQVSEKLFNSISETNNSQGIIAVSKRPKTNKLSLDKVLQNLSTHFIYLHEINNPSNLGAILRTAEAAGVSGIVISTKSADVFSPKSLRSAMGASFRLDIWENAEFEETIEWAKQNNLITIAADINAKKSYTDINWQIPKLIIFGSEAHGLTEIQRTQIEELIHIPMENSVESLNLGVSCGIILFEAKRQINLA